jgi:hypothetical protein
MGMAEGVSSEMQLEVSHVRVLGRMSSAGRNMNVFASDHAMAAVRIDGSYIGEAGQDGVIAPPVSPQRCRAASSRRCVRADDVRAAGRRHASAQIAKRAR